MFLIGAFVFLYTTLEEYYTNTMILPIINGPDEGNLLFASLYFAAAIFGIDLFTFPCWNGICEVRQVILGGFLLAAIYTCIL